MKLPRLRMMPREVPITTAERISTALPTGMFAIVRGAVATGEYASSSEVIRDALRDWTTKRNLRQQGIVELRQIWPEAITDGAPGLTADEVLNRLGRKCVAYGGRNLAGVFNSP